MYEILTILRRSDEFWQKTARRRWWASIAAWQPIQLASVANGCTCWTAAPNAWHRWLRCVLRPKQKVRKRKSMRSPEKKKKQIQHLKTIINETIELKTTWIKNEIKEVSYWSKNLSKININTFSKIVQHHQLRASTELGGV